MRASSLSLACDIRGLTEQQPVAREDTASLSGQEAQYLRGEDRKRVHLVWVAYLLGCSSRTQSKNDR